MKRDIHPDYVVTQVTCTCGNTFTTHSTAKNGQIHADVCSSCHPFYTGKQKILDTGGRWPGSSAGSASRASSQASPPTPSAWPAIRAASPGFGPGSQRQFRGGKQC